MPIGEEGPSPTDLGINDEVENKRPKEYVTGIQENPDGTLDYSKAMVMISEEEAKEEADRLKQREEIITGKVKAQIESCPPNAWVDAEAARKRWGKIYDSTSQTGKSEMQLNEIYAQIYEKNARLAREKIIELESELNEAKTEAEKQAILVKIVKDRNFAQEMENEATERRKY